MRPSRPMWRGFVRYRGVKARADTPIQIQTILAVMVALATVSMVLIDFWRFGLDLGAMHRFGHLTLAT